MLKRKENNAHFVQCHANTMYTAFEQYALKFKNYVQFPSFTSRKSGSPEGVSRNIVVGTILYSVRSYSATWKSVTITQARAHLDT